MFLALAAKSTKHSCFPQESEQLDEDSSSGSTSGSSSSSGSSGSDGGSPGPVTRPRGPPSKPRDTGRNSTRRPAKPGGMWNVGGGQGGEAPQWDSQDSRRCPGKHPPNGRKAPRTRQGPETNGPSPPVVTQLLIE